MLKCPTCGTTYTDETLRFCLADGAPLNDIGGEQQTVVHETEGSANDKTIAMGGGQMRVDIPQPDATRQQYEAHPTPQGSSGGLLKVLLVILGLGLLIVLVALAGVIFYYNSRGDEAANKGNDVKTSAASPAPVRDDNSELRDLIANLQKQLGDQKNAKGGPAGNPVSAPNLSQTTMTTTVRANSPGDGFLALRSLPSAQTGDRLVKIPHGAALQIGACGPIERSVHPGRWCQARYNGYSGYVYDYYVTY